MARNRVELNFEGDDSDLQRAFDNVGSGAKGMASDVGKSAKDMGGGLDRVGESADVTETRFMGLKDGMEGTGDVMEGMRTGNFPQMLQGLADIGSSIANFVIPALKRMVAALNPMTLATKAWAAAQAVLNFVMSMNPIVLVALAVAALVAGFIVAWKTSEKFRDIVKAAFAVLLGPTMFVIKAIGAGIDWLKERFGFGADAGDDMADRAKESAERMGKAWEEGTKQLTSVLDSMADPFERFSHKQMISLKDASANLRKNVEEYQKWLADVKVIYERFGVETAQFVIEQGSKFHGVADQLANSTDRAGKDFARQVADMAKAEDAAGTLTAKMTGYTDQLAKIRDSRNAILSGAGGLFPGFHTGGVVGGHAGQNVMAMLQAGETVIPRGQDGGGRSVVININGNLIHERDAGRWIADALRNNQLVGVT